MLTIYSPADAVRQACLENNLAWLHSFGCQVQRQAGAIRVWHPDVADYRALIVPDARADESSGTELAIRTAIVGKVADSVPGGYVADNGVLPSEIGALINSMPAGYASSALQTPVLDSNPDATSGLDDVSNVASLTSQRLEKGWRATLYTPPGAAGCDTIHGNVMNPGSGPEPCFIFATTEPIWGESNRLGGSWSEFGRGASRPVKVW